MGFEVMSNWRQCGVLTGKIEHDCLGDATHAQWRGAPMVCEKYVLEHQKRYPDIAHIWSRVGRQETFTELYQEPVKK